MVKGVRMEQVTRQYPPGDGNEWVWQAAHRVLGQATPASEDIWITYGPKEAMQCLSDEEATGIRNQVEQMSFEALGSDFSDRQGDAVLTLQCIPDIRKEAS